MATPIQINQGLFTSADDWQLGGTPFAPALENLIIDDTGANISRPGFSSFATTGGTASIIGLSFFDNRALAIDWDRSFFSIDSAGNTVDVTGTALGGSGWPVFASDGTYLAIAGGTTPQRWDGSSNTEAMAGTPPATTNFIEYVDGYWIAALADDQEFRWAGPTSTLRESWSTAQFFQAEGLPDGTTATAVLNRNLYGFGPESIETFYNYGDSSVPFKRTGFVESGIGAPHSLVKADNTLFWLDNHRRFMQLQGSTPVAISTPALDKVLKTYSVVGDCVGMKIDMDSHYLLVWTFPSDGKTLVYDYRLKHWAEWSGWENGSKSAFPASSHVYIPSWNKHLVGSKNTGAIYELQLSAHSDAGEARRCRRRTGWINHATAARKKSKWYDVELYRGDGASGSTEPVLEVRVRDDDKQWTNWQQVGLGLTGFQNSIVRFRFPGIYRRRQIEFVCSDAVSFKIKNVSEEVEGLVS